MNKTTLTENDELRNRAKVLLEEFVFQFSRLVVNTGTNHPIYSPYRYQLGQKLKYGSERTITRILAELSEAGWVFRLPQRKNFKAFTFGPLRLAPTKKLWVRIRRMIRTLKAEDARRQKRKSPYPHKKSRRPKSSSISSLLERREREEEKKEDKKMEEGSIFQKLKPDMSLSTMLEEVIKAKKGKGW